jgi:hypothetical protein
MLWKVLRPRYWILDRRVRTANRAAVAVLFLILGFGGQWAFNALVRDNLPFLRSAEAAALVASFVPAALLFLLLFALLGVGDVMHQLYLTPDLELLLAAPVPSRTIFVAKFLQCSRAALLPALALGAFWLVVAWARGAPAAIYPLLALLLLAAIALTTALVMLLVILLARFLPPQKVRARMPQALALATLAAGLGQAPLAGWLARQIGPAHRLTQALLDPGALGLAAAALSGLALAASLVAYRVFDTAFHEGWDRFRQVPAGPGPGAAPPRRTGSRLARLVRPLPAPLRHFLVKEWLELRRDPRALLSLAQPLILVAAIVLVPLLTSGEGSNALQPLLFLVLVLLLALMLGILPVGGSLLALAAEGRRLALLRSLPISLSHLLRAKFWATWVPMALSWALVFLVAGVWLRFPAWQIGFLVALSAWGLAGASAATVALGGLQVDFQARDLRQRVPTLTGYLVMGANTVFVLLAVALGLWLVARLAPGSPVVLALDALAGLPLVGWIVAPDPWFPLALAGAQLAYGLAVWALWAAAVRRLEAWEGG